MKDLATAIRNNLFLFGYVKKYAPIYIPLIFLSAIFQCISVTIGILGLKYVVDFVEQGNFKHCLFVILVYLSVNLLVKGYFHWTNYYFPLLSQKVSIGMTIERISASQKLDFQCFDIPEYYDIYTRALKSGEKQVSILIGSAIAIVSNITTLISVAAIISSFSMWFLLLAIVQTIISYIVINRQNKLSYDFNYTNTRLTREEGYYKNLCFSPSVQMEDRIFGVIDCIKDKYRALALTLYEKQKKHLKQHTGVGFFQPVSAEIAMAITMVISAVLIITNKMSIGEFVTSINGVQSLTGQLLSLVIQFPRLIQNSRYADDYKQIVEYIPTIEEKSDNIKKVQVSESMLANTSDYLIEFKNVSFKYPSSNEWVLRNLSFTISSRKKTAIVGENGAGKTTIIKLILRLYDPTEGEIFFNGINLKDIQIESLRSCFTSIFQDYNLYSISLSENLFFKDKAKSVKDLLKKVGLDSKFNEKDDADRIISRKFTDDGIVLSGGESQRLCIARALSKNAPIILLDEPSAALDPIIENDIINVLINEAYSKTMIIITHRLSMCTLSDEIFYLEKGTIIERGNHNSLLLQKGKYFTLFNTQAKNYMTTE